MDQIHKRFTADLTNFLSSSLKEAVYQTFVYIFPILFYLAFKMALIHDQFVRLFNASLLDAMHASPFSA